MTGEAGSRGHATRITRVLRSPEFLTDSLQIVKSAVAATAAWWVSADLLDSPMPFLAPWTALLTVHATVYRSMTRGVQTTVASTVGVALSFLIGTYLDVSLWTFGLAILVGLTASRSRWLRDEGIAIATTAIFVLGSGFDEQAPLLNDRLIELALGVGVGIVVNLSLIPPLRDQQASRYVDSMNRRMGEVLISMADELTSSWDTDRADAWVDETVSIDRELETAWQTVRFARESQRANPRHYVPTPQRPRGWRNQRHEADEKVGYEEILARVGEGISHLRHLARTLREATYSHSPWDDAFREEWVSIVRDAGHSIEDPDAEVEPIYDRLDRLANRFSDANDGLPGEVWPIYGSLVTSMRHIAVIVDDVASARSVREGDRSNPTT